MSSPPFRTSLLLLTTALVLSVLAFYLHRTHRSLQSTQSDSAARELLAQLASAHRAGKLPPPPTPIDLPALLTQRIIILTDSTTDPTNRPLDAFGNPFTASLTPTPPVPDSSLLLTVHSPGPDRIPNTPDDITRQTTLPQHPISTPP